MKLRQFFAAYRFVAEQERKQREYNMLVGDQLNYTILKDLINSARQDVRIDVTLKDGTRLEIRREDPFDKFLAEQRFRRSDPEQRW